MINNAITLGSTVRDISTGVQGYAITVGESFNGNLRYSVQPISTDGSTLLDAWDIDQQTLEVVDEGISARKLDPKPYTICVGDLVEDIVSSFTGIVTGITVHLNGCVFCMVVPKVRDNSLLNAAPDGSYMPIERLTKVSDGISAKRASSKVDKPTGGPSTRSIRA